MPRRLPPFLLALPLLLISSSVRNPAAQPQAPQVATLLHEAYLEAEGVSDNWNRPLAFRVVARAQAAAGDVAAARNTLLRARAAVAEQRWSPDGRALWYLDVAAEQARSGDATGAAATTAEAIRSAATVGDPEQRATVFARIAVRRTRAGDAGGAMLDFAWALAAARKASARTERTLGKVAAKMASAGFFAQAEAVADGIDTNPWRDSALRDVAAAMARAGDVSGARRLQDRLTGWERLEVEQAVARANADAGDVAGALEVARGIPARYPSAREAALAEVFVSRADAGDVAGARAALEGVAWQDHAGDVLAALALAQARSGDPAGARASAAEAKKAEADDVAVRRARLFFRIGHAQALAGDAAGARQSFADARKAAQQIWHSLAGYSSEEQAEALRTLVRIAAAQAETGDLPSARATATAIESERERAAACRAVAAIDARRGDVTGVLRWVEALPDPMARAFAYAGMVEALCDKDGRLDIGPPADEED